MPKNSDDLLTRIINSVFYKKSFNKAGKATQNAQSLLGVIKKALDKTKDLGTGGIFDLIREKVVLLGRLIKSYASGRYRAIEIKNLVIIVTGLVYFISPIDLIPDFIFGIGFLDDVALLTFIVRSVDEEIEKFEIWEFNNPEN